MRVSAERECANVIGSLTRLFSESRGFREFWKQTYIDEEIFIMMQ